MSRRSEAPASPGRSRTGKITIVVALAGVVALIVFAPRGSPDTGASAPPIPAPAEAADPAGLDDAAFPLLREPAPDADSGDDADAEDASTPDGAPVL